MTRIAVYPGSFDPLHNGHREIIRRTRPAFDELVVAVLQNEEKKPLFDAAERVEMIREVLDRDALSDVKVVSFSGLLVDFMAKIGGCAVVRGLRAVSDFEYEFQMALMNRRLDPRFETFFLATSEQYSFLSSRLVKEVYGLGGDLTGLVPRPILTRLEQRMRGGGEVGGGAAVSSGAPAASAAVPEGPTAMRPARQSPPRKARSPKSSDVPPA